MSGCYSSSTSSLYLITASSALVRMFSFHQHCHCCCSVLAFRFSSEWNVNTAPVATQDRHQDLTRKFPFFSIIILFFVFLAGPEQNKHSQAAARRHWLQNCPVIKCWHYVAIINYLNWWGDSGGVCPPDWHQNERVELFPTFSAQFWFLVSVFPFPVRAESELLIGISGDSGPPQRVVRHGFCGHREH